MQKFRAQSVIFDLDGTLADTFPLIVAAWNAAMREPLGRDYETHEIVSRFGIPDADMLRRELQGYDEPIITATIEKYFASYEALHDCVQPFEGATELLESLHARGIPMGVMTGKGRRAAEISVRLLGWQKYFGSVISGDDVVEQKPAPEGVLKAAQELGVAPESCAFIGDSPADIGAGKAAGMFTIAAAWHAYYHDKLRALEPHAWAQTPAEVLSFLELT